VPVVSPASKPQSREEQPASAGQLSSRPLAAASAPFIDITHQAQGVLLVSRPPSRISRLSPNLRGQPRRPPWHGSVKYLAVGATRSRLASPWRSGAPQRPGELLRQVGRGSSQGWRALPCLASNSGMKLTPTVGAFKSIIRGVGMGRMIESSLGRSLSRGRSASPRWSRPD
jgi:hypothetical protein